jgi:hypothetical protein
MWRGPKPDSFTNWFPLTTRRLPKFQYPLDPSLSLTLREAKKNSTNSSLAVETGDNTHIPKPNRSRTQCYLRQILESAGTMEKQYIAVC